MLAASARRAPVSRNQGRGGTGTSVMSHLPEAPGSARPAPPEHALSGPALSGQALSRPLMTASDEPVSVVMPVRNEERYLADSVRHILSQDYDGEMELILAIGPSRDRTAEIAAGLAAADERVTVVDNPTGGRSAAVNIAARAARHRVIVRVDGHSMLPEGYIRTAVETLRETGAVNVGGIMAAEGVTPFQRAVAWAMTSPFGVGAARFHTGGEAGPADTAYMGVFRRGGIEDVGGFYEEVGMAGGGGGHHR